MLIMNASESNRRQVHPKNGFMYRDSDREVPFKLPEMLQAYIGSVYQLQIMA